MILHFFGKKVVRFNWFFWIFWQLAMWLTGFFTCLFVDFVIKKCHHHDSIHTTQAHILLPTSVDKIFLENGPKNFGLASLGYKFLIFFSLIHEFHHLWSYCCSVVKLLLNWIVLYTLQSRNATKIFLMMVIRNRACLKIHFFKTAPPTLIETSF